MKTRVCLLVLVLVMGVLPLAAWPAEASEPLAPATLDPDVMGMVIRDPWYDFGTAPGQPFQPNRAAQDRMGEMLEYMGVRWVRFEFHIEGGDVAGQVARNDYFINEVAPRHGFKVLGLLSFNLIRGREVLDLNSTDYLDIDETPYGGGVNDYIDIWLDRALFIADRYEGRIDAYQILNEQNRMGDTTTIEPEVTARLLTKFYRLFHEGSELWRDDVEIVLGGLHPAGTGYSGTPQHVSDQEYLRRIYESEPFQNYRTGEEPDAQVFPIDGLGFHPYPEEIRISLQNDLDLIRSRLDDIRAVLVEVGDPLLPFWITEIGYNTAFKQQNEAGQVAFMQGTFTDVATRPDVAVVFWFKYEDFPPATGPWAQQWGVVRIPFEQGVCPGGACYDPLGRPTLRRPAFWIYRDMAGGPTAPEPPAQADIDAPQWGSPDTPYTIRATVSRTSAAQPVTYTWSVGGTQVRQTSGDLNDTLTFRRSLPGRYTIFLEASNAGGTVITTHTIFIGERVFLPFIGN